MTRHLRFLAGGALLAFALPFVLTDLVAIDRDLYYGIYAGSVFALFALWLRSAGRPVRQVLTRNWRVGVALAVLFGGVMAQASSRTPSSARSSRSGPAASWPS
jgi:membrane protease YdiL (CAAX protease family)